MNLEQLAAAIEVLPNSHLMPQAGMVYASALRAAAELVRGAQAQELSDAETRAYAEGRADQYEDDCAQVRQLFDNLNDVDAIDDGRINTTRVRELLSHFDIPIAVECSLPCTRPECDGFGCTADRINTVREQRIAAISNKEPT